MNVKTYQWTGGSALERCYRISRPGGGIIGKSLIEYNLLIFNADGLLHECPNSDQSCSKRPDEWRLRPGVKNWFRTLDWTCREQAPHLALIGYQIGAHYERLSDVHEILNAVVDLLLVQGSHSPALVSVSPAVEAYPGCRLYPEPLLKVLSALAMPARHALYIGELDTDRAMAKEAGMDYCPAGELFHW